MGTYEYGEDKILCKTLPKSMIEQAKEMHKEQMIDFAIWILSGGMSKEEAKTITNTYYKHFIKETYGGGEQ